MLELLAFFSMISFAGTLANKTLQPSSPTEIASAVADCWSAVGSHGIQEKKLEQLGWTRGEIANRNRDVRLLSFFSKSGSDVLVSPQLISCTVQARVAEVDAVPTVAEGVGQRLTLIDRRTTADRRGADYRWFSEPHRVLLRQTGTAKESSVMVAVVSMELKIEHPR